MFYSVTLNYFTGHFRRLDGGDGRCRGCSWSWWTAWLGGVTLQLFLLHHLHRLRLFLHPQPIHRCHHWQLQRTQKEGRPAQTLSNSISILLICIPTSEYDDLCSLFFNLFQTVRGRCPGDVFDWVAKELLHRHEEVGNQKASESHPEAWKRSSRFVLRHIPVQKVSQRSLYWT